MNENEMGYRGSKSKSNKYFVKEQRVDGSWDFNAVRSILKSLRCTLMSREICPPVKIPTKQLKTRLFSTLSTQLYMNPWFITGFSDAESSFIISIYRDEKSKTKWRVTPSFSIHIHIKDISLLEAIKKTLGVGKVRKNSKNTALFRIDNIQELQVIIDHFNKYPLVSAKRSDFLLFEECYNLIKQKQHLSLEGLEKILAFRYNLNKGLVSEELIKAFPNIVAIDRPEFKFKGIPNPFWISGFVSGDSTFCVSIEKSNSHLGQRVRLIFGTCLHIRDKELLIGMANYFNDLEPKTSNQIDNNLLPSRIMQDKYIYDSEARGNSLLQIKNYFFIVNKIIPFFNDYPILGIKSLDFADFKKVAELMKTKQHLTSDGLSKIIEIVKGMNLDRNLEKQF